jgi:chromosome segregation protein
MADLAHDAALARTAADAARHALAEATARVRQAAEAERVALETARAGQRDLEQKRSVLAVREKSFSESAARRFALSEARSAAEAGRAELTLRRDGALAELADLAEQSDLQEALQQAQLVANAERASAAEARAMVQTLIREGTERARRRQAISDEVKSWEERRHRAAGQMAEVQRRLADVTAEQAQLAEAPALFLEKRRLLLDAISAAERERALASDRLAVAEVALGDIERGLRAASGVLSEAREQKLRSDLRLEAAVSQRGEILNMIRDALDMTPADLAKKLAAETSVEAEEGETAERQLERLKQDRERLGAVNLQADDELREVEARRDELAAERNDLDSAIRRLRAGIGSLNREGRERLLAAFSTVQGHFEKLFVSLFGGGTAQLELIESDDPLEAGLEIIARPPGKKPTVLTLLSGGEQALTAIALIFAVFLTNPSPICVLDEVDAPLDDANVERYCALLTDMAQATDTRFIVITHNPLTMSRMDRLFGVTMAERGVSQLVSVDLQTAEQFLEAS